MAATLRSTRQSAGAREAEIFKAVFWHNIVSLVGLIVLFYAHVTPSWMP